MINVDRTTANAFDRWMDKLGAGSTTSVEIKVRLKPKLSCNIHSHSQ